ncbi:unnamed protein product [Symbiodinium pilosum]|uniref:Uncharacterized protein n=1 Tax=Symbiodinium pilosum TaxID=2952 RepID=A0A812W2E7_SYMPI|nr:unnamed protein product [Symbiodinium pilosum]
MDGIELLARASSHDSERTKLLKQVLLSSSKLHRELRVTLGTPAPKASKFGSFVPSTEKLRKQKELQAASPSAASLKEKLQLCAQGDSDVCETMTPGRELSPVLKSCGARIGSLSDRLFTAEGQLVLRGGALPPREEEETHLIEIVPRGQQASAATRHKAEAAAERALQQHARFAALEDLQQTLQTRFSYEDLRQSFPRRSRWNPNLYLLTDETLKNPAEFKEAVWRKLPKEAEEDAPRGAIRWRRTVAGAPGRPSMMKTSSDLGAKASNGKPSVRASVL